MCSRIRFLLLFIIFAPVTAPPIAIILWFSKHYLKTQILTSTDPSCQFSVLGDFVIHNKHWLLQSSDTSNTGRAPKAFVINSKLYQMADLPTCIAGPLGDYAFIFEFTLTLISSSFFSIIPLSPLGSTDFLLPFFIPTPNPRCRLCHCDYANWDSFIEFQAS